MDLAPRAALAAAKPAAPQRWLILVNPAAGYHRASGWLPALSDRLERQLQAEVLVTRDFEHIAELVHAAPSASDVAVFGGDGTIAQVANCMRLDQQRLLPLPGGTGNGLARDLGLTSIGQALAAARAGQSRAIDVLEVSWQTGGRHGSRLAISTAGLGYAAETAVSARRLAPSLGRCRYALASILQAGRMPARQFTVQVNDEPAQERRLTNIMVNNTRHVGNFHVFHRASPCDGQMDTLLTAQHFGKQMLHNLSLLTPVSLYDSSKERRRARCLFLRSATPMRLMLDGETWDNVDEVKFSILAQRLLCYSRLT